jgi:hypothetical protein
VNRHEELYALITFFVERHYLREHGRSYHLSLNYSSPIALRSSFVVVDWNIPLFEPISAGASFSEHFYGLKRRRKPVIETERANIAVGGVPKLEKLRRIDIFQSLVFLVSTIAPLGLRLQATGDFV